MYSINDELKERITDLNELLEGKYKAILGKNGQELRNFIEENIGKIQHMKKLDNKKLKSFYDNGGIVGVDGSNNRMGGAFPHFVEVYQALAKSTSRKDDSVIKTDIYAPLIELDENLLENNEKIIEDKKNIKLSNLEVEAALDSIDKFRPFAILMDGGLIRYNIYAYDKWQELKTRCEEEGIILIGVIKDIKTSMIGDKMKELNPEIKGRIYDREMLYGVLEYGEMILIQHSANKKELEGYASVFLRSSLQPSVIGMDIIESQREHIEEMARLVFTLTPENSRGVPLWLDIVDKEVKITDDIMRGLMERYMDRGIYERFFVSERDKRA
mgnify:FL=1|jgi:hypothetical protein